MDESLENEEKSAEKKKKLSNFFKVGEREEKKSKKLNIEERFIMKKLITKYNDDLKVSVIFWMKFFRKCSEILN
jgi:hypothetical protein